MTICIANARNPTSKRDPIGFGNGVNWPWISIVWLVVNTILTVCCRIFFVFPFVCSASPQCNFTVSIFHSRLAHSSNQTSRLFCTHMQNQIETWLLLLSLLLLPDIYKWASSWNETQKRRERRKKNWITKYTITKLSLGLVLYFIVQFPN